MQRLFILFFFIFIGIFTFNDAFAQRRGKKVDTTAEPFGFNFTNPKKKRQTLPFQILSNLIVVKVQVDDGDTLNFILDTGVSSIIITNPDLIERVRLNFVREVQISGAGEEVSLSANISVGHKITFGAVQAFQQNLVVLSEDILQLSEFLGIPIHGIFGHDIFANYVVNIDFSNLTISLFKPNEFKFRKKYGNQYPIVLTDSKPYTDAFSISSNNNELVPVRLVIDTGAGHALLLDQNEHSIPLPNKVIRANLGRGLNGQISGYIGRVSKLNVGKVQLANVLASYPDSISFSLKFRDSDESRQGSIGCDFLRRFKLTLNYHDNYMALKPIRKRMKDTFEHDMSGLDVKAKGDNLNNFIIENVIVDSPAWNAGLRNGDEIMYINEFNKQEINMSDIVRLLSRKEGKRIEIFYKRGTQLMLADFYLKRII